MYFRGSPLPVWAEALAVPTMSKSKDRVTRAVTSRHLFGSRVGVRALGSIRDGRLLDIASVCLREQDAPEPGRGHDFERPRPATNSTPRVAETKPTPMVTML